MKSKKIISDNKYYFLQSDIEKHPTMLKRKGEYIMEIFAAIIFIIFLGGLLMQVIGFLMPLFVGMFYVSLILLGLYCIYLIYQAIYFESKKFLRIKKEIQQYTNECNELNVHIEELKNTYADIRHIDYGNATYTDNSIYRFKRPELNKIKKEYNVHECSLSVCRSAQQQPFKYVCKYFNIDTNEKTLEVFEKVFNDFSAAEQGKILLVEKKEEIIGDLSSKIPFLIKWLGKKTLPRKLGFDDIDLSKAYFPKYTFHYVSAGGNSSMKCDVTFDLENLEKFITYLSDIVKFRKSVAGQRSLMTSQLREKIKIRDNYTCQKCGISTKDEPHLLLEIDHIIPLAKKRTYDRR